MAGDALLAQPIRPVWCQDAADHQCHNMQACVHEGVEQQQRHQVSTDMQQATHMSQLRTREIRRCLASALSALSSSANVLPAAGEQLIVLHANAGSYSCGHTGHNKGPAADSAVSPKVGRDGGTALQDTAGTCVFTFDFLKVGAISGRFGLRTKEIGEAARETGGRHHLDSD